MIFLIQIYEKFLSKQFTSFKLKVYTWAGDV